MIARIIIKQNHIWPFIFYKKEMRYLQTTVRLNISSTHNNFSIVITINNILFYLRSIDVIPCFAGIICQTTDAAVNTKRCKLCLCRVYYTRTFGCLLQIRLNPNFLSFTQNKHKSNYLLSAHAT